MLQSMILCFSVFYLLWISTVCFRVNMTSFVKLSSEYCRPRPIDQKWFVRSRLDCALKCLNRTNGSCYCFMYNTETKLCTPCSGLSPDGDPPTEDDGDVYFHDSCKAYPDFKLTQYTANGTTISAYAARFTDRLNYTAADATCRCMNAQLFVAKTKDRFSLFVSIGEKNETGWIGLNDVAAEGHLVWVDDGQEINSSLRSDLFVSSAVNDDLDDCVYKTSSNNERSQVLDVTHCDEMFSYICEIPRCSL